jgi:hypothetical protein
VRAVTEKVLHLGAVPTPSIKLCVFNEGLGNLFDEGFGNRYNGSRWGVVNKGVLACAHDAPEGLGNFIKGSGIYRMNGSYGVDRKCFGVACAWPRSCSEGF